MALNVNLQLANSEGLMKVLHFTGLSHPVLVRPTIYGEPLLTAQAFYYLEELESVAHIRYESGNNELNDEEMEYLIDNYLFAYSKAHPNSRMTFKVSRGKFWLEDPSDMYVSYDQEHTESLALDQLNDPSVKFVRPVDPEDTVDHSDWRIAHNYTQSILESYIHSLGKVLDKKVSVLVLPSSEHDGYIGKLRVVKCDHGLIDFFQAEALENISVRSLIGNATSVPLKTTRSPPGIESLPIERITETKQYRPILLSHFFSGLKEFNPLKGYLGYYNVLEYYFEEAPRLLSKIAKNELEQLKCVLELLTTDLEVQTFVAKLGAAERASLQTPLQTSTGHPILGFTPATLSAHMSELARWLYEIRCAVVHSKKTRKGKIAASFEPYSKEARNVKVALPFIQWLAIICIEKDQDLGLAP